MGINAKSKIIAKDLNHI